MRSGFIANRFIDFNLKSDFLIFSGIDSNFDQSLEQSFKKEEIEILSAISTHPDGTVVYFSSCKVGQSAFESDSLISNIYRIEKLIASKASKYMIFRLPEVVSLPLLNDGVIKHYLDLIKNKVPFELEINSKFNFIDIDDVHEIVNCILRQRRFINTTINVASSELVGVADLIKYLERLLETSASFTSLAEGKSEPIDISTTSDIIKELKIDFSGEYLYRSLSKYISFQKKLMSVIVPTYNEEHGIEEFYRRTKAVLELLEPRFEHEIIFVNDFSKDNTLKKLHELAMKDNAVKIINFSRNFGNQIGITAGVDYSKGDLAVIIDDDLQDPPEIILSFLAKWHQGFKVVYGVRPKRHGVGPLFKLAAKIYYRIIGSLSDTKIPNDTGDFRLIDRMVINSLKTMREENRYYRGLVAWVGFSQCGVEYERDQRYAGVSTFSFKKYVNFALNGLTSFTEKPLYFSSLAGVIITSVSFCLAVILIISKILDPTFSIRGWTSIIVIILFFGGIQLLSIGVVGIYISKIYREVKQRPLYIVESTKNIEVD